jgi:hypothetical protein
MQNRAMSRPSLQNGKFLLQIVLLFGFLVACLVASFPDMYHSTDALLEEFTQASTSCV